MLFHRMAPFYKMIKYPLSFLVCVYTSAPKATIVFKVGSKPDKLTVKQMTGNIKQQQYSIGNDDGL